MNQVLEGMFCILAIHRIREWICSGIHVLANSEVIFAYLRVSACEMSY